jgi:hypothetical protein
VSEIGRRQVLLDNLKKLVANGTIKESVAPSSASNVRTGGARLSMDSSKSTATQNPLTSDQALLQRQRDIIKMQDDMLLDIEVGVGRLHEKVSLCHHDLLLYRVKTLSISGTHNWR